MAMQRWDPFSGLERDLERMLSIGSGQGSDRRAAMSVFAPTTDILTRGDDMVVKVELPGVAEKDIDVSITENLLTISGRRQQDSETTEKGGYLVRESFRGSFERSMSLPPGVDPEAIVASYHDGVLEIVVPKAAAMHERRTRHISLQAQEKEEGQGQLSSGQTSQGGDESRSESQRPEERQR